jgi:hypothetical protein
MRARALPAPWRLWLTANLSPKIAGSRLTLSLSPGLVMAAVAAIEYSPFGEALQAGLASLEFDPAREGLTFGGSQVLMRANSPSSTVRETPAAQGVRFILVAGESDAHYLRSAEAFAAELDQLRVPHALFRLPGGHESWVWTNGLALGLVELKPQLEEHGR